jgi:hypothetical protein
MADEDDTQNDVEFIPAFEDANLRLSCFQAVVGAMGAGILALSPPLEAAKQLYAWCMETDEDAQTDDAQAESGTECLQKH